MSCCLIDLENYVRVGAYLGGFTQIKKWDEPILREWNFEKGRCNGMEEVLADFVELYKLNVKGVELRYNEEEAKEEMNLSMFSEDIAKYSALAKKHFRNEEKMVEAFKRISHFFRSVSYQIDDNETNRKANEIMNKYARHMTNILGRDEEECWGEFYLEG